VQQLRTIATVRVTRAVHTAAVVTPLSLCSSRRCSATVMVAVTAAGVVVKVICSVPTACITTIIIILYTEKHVRTSL
jgi:hypothetical protein